MNIAKTNETIARMYRLGEAGAIASELDKSPLLTLVEQPWWDDEITVIERKWSELRFPFDYFRFHYRLLAGDQVAGYFCKTGQGFRVVGKPPYVAGDQWFCAWYKDNSTGQFRSLRPDGKGEVEIEDVDDKPLARSGWQLHMDIASKFSLFYVDMGLPVAEVVPRGYDTDEAVRRKVSWRKRRDYWTVLDASHKANDKRLAKGAAVSQSAADLHRSAHHRRAHWRTLRAAKWGKSCGKRVFVKQTWVGPPEWMEGNQAYRIRKCGK